MTEFVGLGMACRPRVLRLCPHVAVLHKPFGLHFHRKAVTSGILLMGRSKEAAAALADRFKRREVVKYYVALTARKPSRKEGSVIGDMTRSRRKSWILTRDRTNPAITRFISSGLPGVEPAGTRLLVLKPETGRTHQLRVACKSLGAPILGDSLYAASDQAAAFDRCYLHAAAIRVPPLFPGDAPLQDGSACATSASDITTDLLQSTMPVPFRCVYSSAPLQVICPPDQGRLFQSTAFQEAFARYFPSTLEEENGVWMPTHKWMRSGPMV